MTRLPSTIWTSSSSGRRSADVRSWRASTARLSTLKKLAMGWPTMLAVGVLSMRSPGLVDFEHDAVAVDDDHLLGQVAQQAHAAEFLQGAERHVLIDYDGDQACDQDVDADAADGEGQGGGAEDAAGGVGGGDGHHRDGGHAGEVQSADGEAEPEA